MQKRQIVAHVLVPADQQSSETVHPTMGPLHHPPASFVAGCMRDRLSFLTPCPDVSGEPKRGQQLAHFIDVIAFVQTHPLWLLGSGRRPLDRDTDDGLLDHLEVIAVRALNGEADRHAAAVGEDTPFGADLPAVGRILAHLFPPRGGLWSSPRPWPATPSQSPARLRTQPDLAPRRPGRPRRLPTLGSGGAPNSWNKGLCPVARSIDTQSAGRRRWYPWLGDHRRGAGGTPAGAASGAGATAGCAPTGRRVSANHAGRSLTRDSSIGLLWQRSFSPQDTRNTAYWDRLLIRALIAFFPRLILTIIDNWFSMRK